MNIDGWKCDFSGFSEEDLKFMQQGGLISEFGSSGNVGFAQGRLCDENGKDLLCGCGELASSVIMGSEAYKAMCNKCQYGE